MQLLIKNLRQLVTVANGGKPWKAGPAMRDLGVIEDGALFIENDLITWTGPTKDFRHSLEEGAEVIDGSAFVALPGFVDSHTHLVFAGSREDEFALRAEGATYQEIAARGGGILSTVRSTRQSSKKDLKKLAARRLDAMMQHGTTTVEIKSGYGLEPDTEIRMLEAIRELSDEHYMTIVPTFLGAHAVPPEYADRGDEYVDLIIHHMLPYVAKRNLAVFCDVFCERGYFSPEQSKRILLAALELGLKPKLHADELAASGGSLLAAEIGAVSADHLEHIDPPGIRRLQEKGVVAVLLPGVSFFLNHGYAPARDLIDSGVPVAIASDFNPGSCMSFDMPLMATIACAHMNMTPEEAITALTLNGAAALGMSDRVGSLEPGKQADIILCEIPNYRYLAYHFGTQHVHTIIKRGTILEF
ncbi:MAG: imidazolonepropionase [Bacteroidota bacterium]